jgi:hypothetical protein
MKFRHRGNEGKRMVLVMVAILALEIMSAILLETCGY